MKFQEKLEKAITQNNSLLCIGLDPDIKKLKRGETQFLFNKLVVDETADFVCAYKPNIAFYAAGGIKGLRDLKKTIDYIHKNYPDVCVILDAKRGDIATTSEMLVKEVFDVFEADAVTVNPYLGEDALVPFFKRYDKGIIILCRTSNPSAGDLQDLKIDGEPLYVKVAKKITSWDKKYKNLLMVVGATYKNELKNIRKIAPDMTFLVPGIGAQGGDLKSTLLYGLRKDGKGLIITSTRAIIYDQNPRTATQKLRDEINKYRKNI